MVCFVSSFLGRVESSIVTFVFDRFSARLAFGCLDLIYCDWLYLRFCLFAFGLLF